MREMLLKYCVLFLLVKCSLASIYQINDTEYDRMPPLFELDEYRKCLRADEGLYCVVNVVLTASPENDLMRLIRNYSHHYKTRYNHSITDLGVCVTKRCKKFLQSSEKGSNVDLQLSLDRCLNEYYQNDYGLEAKVSTIYYCNRSNDNTNIDIQDWIFGAIIVLLIMTNIVATFYDMRIRKFKEQSDPVPGKLQFLSCFSMIQNWKSLTATEQKSPGGDGFESIHGIRVLCTILMVISHVMWINGSSFIDNPQDFEKAYHNTLYYIIFNGMMLVQIYFLISGCLFTYNLTSKLNAQKDTSNQGLFSLVMFYRWSRLTPSLAITIGFTMTWFRHLGTGPLWNFYVTTVVNDCRQYWWIHMLYFNNYVENNLCLIQTWHVAVEFQLYAVGLIVYLATQSRGRNLALLILFTVGCVAPAMHVLFQNMDGVLILDPEFYRTLKNYTWAKMHILSHNNLACFAMGMQFGLFIHYAQKNKLDFSKYKTVLSWLGLFTPLLMILVCLSGQIFYMETEKASLPLRMLYAAVHRPLFGMFLMIGLMTLMFNINDRYRYIFGCRGWKIPSRLAYAVYVVHFNIIYYIQGIRTQLHTASFFNLVIYHLGIVWLSFLIAVPMYVLVEAPTSRLVKLCLFGTNEQKQAKNKNK